MFDKNLSFLIYSLPDRYKISDERLHEANELEKESITNTTDSTIHDLR